MATALNKAVGWWTAPFSRSAVPLPRSSVIFTRSSCFSYVIVVGLVMVLVSASGLGFAIMSHFLKTSKRDIGWSKDAW